MKVGSNALTFVVVDVSNQYPTRDFWMVEEGGGTISSFNIEYDWMSWRQYTRGGVKSVQPRAHSMISNIEGGDNVPMGSISWVASPEKRPNPK